MVAGGGQGFWTMTGEGGRVRAWRKALGLLMLLLLVLVLGVFAFSRIDPTGFGDARRSVRVALGLPKIWVKGVNTDTRGLVAVACPADAIVIVTGGQSNAANALSDPLQPDSASHSYMVQDGRCYPLRDPVLGATGQGGSLWSGLGPALARQSGRPVVFINGAVGGSQLGDWLDERSGYAARLLTQVAAARQAGMTADHVIWIQGETDAAARTDPAVYVGQLKALMVVFDASGTLPADVPWLVFRSTRCKDRPNNGAALDAAVTAFAEQSPRVTAGPLASALGNEARWDTCHFNGHGRDLLVAETLPLLGEGR